MTIYFTDGGTLECNRIELVEGAYTGTTSKIWVDEYRMVEINEVDYIES